nr:transposase [Spirosoma utsteinense]
MEATTDPQWAAIASETRFEKASRPETARGFVPVAKRWVVERTIAWTNFFRRIVKDYEYAVSSSVNWLYLANIQIMLQRIDAYCQT